MPNEQRKRHNNRVGIVTAGAAIIVVALWLFSGQGSALIVRDTGAAGGSYTMSCFENARRTRTQITAIRASSIAISHSALCRKSARLLLVVCGAASLAACAQSTVAVQRSEFIAGTGQGTAEHHRQARASTVAHALIRHHSPYRDANATRVASHGVASFYSEGTRTASGEKFDKNELTAAHPTLPFGTRLRVTDEDTGRSVTVRVNDRGPFVHGRVVDVSRSAALALGMIDKGVANVRLDVVE